MTQLSAADDTFSSFLGPARRADTRSRSSVVLSLSPQPSVGAYVFGLLAGLGRETPETMRKHGASAETALPKLRVVPEAVWLAALGVFSALYLAFFLRAGPLSVRRVHADAPGSFTVAEVRPSGASSSSAASWRSILPSSGSSRAPPGGKAVPCAG